MSAPEELYRRVAVDRAVRWGYSKTLDTKELTTFIDEQIADANLRADADAAWEYALGSFGRLS